MSSKVTLAVVLLLLFVGVCSGSVANDYSKQQVNTELKKIAEDSLKIDYLRKVASAIREDDSLLSIHLINQAKTLAENGEFKNRLVKIYIAEAKFYYVNANSNQSKKVLQDAFKYAQSNKLAEGQMDILFAEIKLFYTNGNLEDVVPRAKYLYPILRSLKNPEKEAYYLSQIGRKFYSLGNYPEAMDFYVQSQNIFDKHNIRNENYGHLLHNIGSVFKRQNNLEKALEYYEQELALGKEIKSDQIIAEGLYLAAGMYSELGDPVKGRKYNERSLAIYEKLGSDQMVALLTGNMAGDYADEGDYPRAISSLNKALKIFERNKDYDKIAWIQSAIGNNYSKMGLHNEALEFLKKAEAIAFKTTNKQLLRRTEIARSMAFVYYKKGDYKEAFDTYLDYEVLDDSLLSKEKLKLVGELESKYENEKSAAQIAILNKDKQLKAAELEKKEAEVHEEKMVRNLTFGGIGLVIVVLLVTYRGYRVNKKNNALLSKQNDEINLQNMIIEEKNKNITDSIAYAKRIQAAILPPESLLNEYLKNGFIYYEPKDIVAGDFYWLEKANDKVLFAAADCTGHGVPGAMISVVCHNALNRAVREFELTDPAQVLNKVRELVIETFEKSEEEVSDGMDIALCMLDRENQELKYSGANNSLYIVRNEELIELKADKQPISQYVENKPFTLHNFKLQPGDTIYSFTDGFADQFGGEKGKKFKYKPFKELLISIQSEAMDRQYEILKDTFHTWRGDLEQIDDVCILGVRI